MIVVLVLATLTAAGAWLHGYRQGFNSSRRTVAGLLRSGADTHRRIGTPESVGAARSLAAAAALFEPPAPKETR